MAQEQKIQQEEETPMTNEELLKAILSEAKEVSEGIEDISKITDTANKNAGQNVENIEKAAVSLREKTCVHLNELVDDMKKAVSVKL